MNNNNNNSKQKKKKFIDQYFESESKLQKYNQDRSNALTLQSAVNPVAYRLLIRAGLLQFKRKL